MVAKCGIEFFKTIYKSNKMFSIHYIRCEIEVSASKIIHAGFLSFPSTAFYRSDAISADQILEK